MCFMCVWVCVWCVLCVCMCVCCVFVYICVCICTIKHQKFAFASSWYVTTISAEIWAACDPPPYLNTHTHTHKTHAQHTHVYRRCRASRRGEFNCTQSGFARDCSRIWSESQCVPYSHVLRSFFGVSGVSVRKKKVNPTWPHEKPISEYDKIYEEFYQQVVSNLDN